MAATALLAAWAMHGALGGTGWTMTVRPADAWALGAEASRVVRGVVTASRTTWSLGGAGVWTQTSLSVLPGFDTPRRQPDDTAPTVLQVATPGGHAGRTTVAASGVPRPRPCDELILALAMAPNLEAAAYVHVGDGLATWHVDAEGLAARGLPTGATDRDHATDAARLWSRLTAFTPSPASQRVAP